MCDGSQSRPFGSVMQAFSRVLNGRLDAVDSLIEILLKPNPSSQPYLVLPTDLLSSASMGQPFQNLKGK